MIKEHKFTTVSVYFLLSNFNSCGSFLAARENRRTINYSSL